MPVVTYSLYNRDADVCVERLRLNMEETQVPDAHAPDLGCRAC